MDSMETILNTFLPDRIPSGRQDQIFTPSNIAQEMVDALPDEVFNSRTTFLDPTCKSGIFLYEIYKKLMESDAVIKEYPDRKERHFHIINNQLYGIAMDKQCQLISMRTAYGQLKPDSHIITIENYIAMVKNPDQRFLYEVLKKEFNTVKFDVVIGNPPYNNDIYLDFVQLGHKLSNECSCWITPAKWQAKGGAKNEQFRKDIVPYMSKIVYYPEATDIFDIQECDGITYYLVDKSETTITSITNKSDDIILFDSQDNYDTKDLAQISLLNCANSVIKKLNGIPRINVSVNDKHRFFVAEARMYGWGTERVNNGIRYKSCKCYTNELKYNVISVPQVVNADDLSKLAKVRMLTFSSDRLDECKSYVSFMESKFVKFLMLSSRIGTMVGGEAKRFVPAPEAFDHIFTDAELYEKYNLTSEEINIIESVIKERK